MKIKRSDSAAQLAEIEKLRSALRKAEAEVQRLLDEAAARGALVDILHDVMGSLSMGELFHMLARRLARALNLSHSSVIFAKSGDTHGTVASAHEDPQLENLQVELDKYPEIEAALASEQPVLIPDIWHSDAYKALREAWENDGSVISVRSIIALPFRLDALIRPFEGVERIGHELGGPDAVSWNEFWQRLKAAPGMRRRPSIHVPVGLMRMNALVTERLLGNIPLTRDLLTMLEHGDEATRAETIANLRVAAAAAQQEARFAVLAVSPASAHITLKGKEATIGTPYDAVFVVPHGCAGSATTKRRVLRWSSRTILAIGIARSPLWPPSARNSIRRRIRPTSS